MGRIWLSPVGSWAAWPWLRSVPRLRERGSAPKKGWHSAIVVSTKRTCAVAA